MWRFSEMTTSYSELEPDWPNLCELSLDIHPRWPCFLESDQACSALDHQGASKQQRELVLGAHQPHWETPIRSHAAVSRGAPLLAKSRFSTAWQFRLEDRPKSSTSNHALAMHSSAHPMVNVNVCWPHASDNLQISPPILRTSTLAGTTYIFRFGDTQESSLG